MKAKALFLWLALAGISLAAPPLFTGPFGPDGTWNLYQLVQTNATWDDSRKKAEAMPAPAGNPQAKGHLVTFSSPAENQFMRLLNREGAWCGLTDEERFGGREAGSRPSSGWKWLDGGQPTFSNWLPDQPDDWKGGGNGEDGVLFESSGRWGDNGSGLPGQSATQLYYVVEWETRSQTPVAGATPYERAWPEESVMPEYIRGKWNARWVSGHVKFPDHWIELPRSITNGLHLLSPAAAAKAKTKPLIQSKGTAIGKQPWLWLTTRGGNRTAWMPGADGETNFPTLPPEEPCIGAVIGKIHVEKAGLHTFAISTRDAFALRIGGMKWKSARGNGYIDPLDPLTVTQPMGTTVSKSLAVMDLLAGDHLVEALWLAEGTSSEFQVLSAPGVHASENSTTAWRPLGHAAASEKVASLGITDAGWTVECLPSGDKPLGLQDGLIKLELASERISKSKIPAIRFAEDPENGAAAFPNGGAGDNWPLRANARLVVPSDGVYHIRLRASGLAALRIKGAGLKGVSQAPQGLKDFHRQADTFDFNGRSELRSEPEIVTAWDLKSGEWDIDVFFVKNLGPAALEISSCPDGPYLPAPLGIGGATLADDVPGLPHAP
jgi:hypothetical protein